LVSLASWSLLLAFLGALELQQAWQKLTAAAKVVV
jgi:hypothetical protein